MLYRFLHTLFRIATRAFFRHYEVKGKERIPTEGPLLVVANHPSTFMDPIVIATALNRKVHFITKAEAFRSRFAAWILPKFNMIPIYRKIHDPELMHKNEDTFRKVYEILEQGGCVLIFPEGISLTDRQLKQLKTGAARMAFGTEQRHNYSKNVKILPVGLNYSNPHQFQSDLFVQIDAPISVSDYYEAHRQDAFKANHALTETIRKRIEQLIVAIQDKEVDQLIEKVETVYKSSLIRELGYSKQIPEHDFKVTRMISERIHYFTETNPERVQRFRDDIEHYFQLLHKLEIEDKNVRKQPSVLPFPIRFLFAFLYLLIGFPVFLFGALNNYVPYKLPYRIAQWIKVEPQFYGAVMLTAGTFVFLIFYLTQIFLVQHLFLDYRITLAYGLLLPISGFFAYRYWKRLTLWRRRWRFYSLFFTSQKLVRHLIMQRERIMVELESGRKEYDAFLNAKTE
jgi:1-acyl-sn-glycerol-3-phosphate acyltransferase